jgi:hypothetical protein
MLPDGNFKYVKMLDSISSAQSNRKSNRNTISLDGGDLLGGPHEQGFLSKN